MQIWIAVAVGGALLKAVSGSYQKHLTDSFDKFQLSYITAVISLLLFIPLAGWTFLTEPIMFTPKLVIASVLKGGLGVVSLIAVFKALQTEDFSVFVPLVRFSPLMIALLEPIVFGTAFRPELIVAAVLGVIGAYVVMLEDNGLFEPIRRLTEDGPQLAIFVAFCSTVGALLTRYIGVESFPASIHALISNMVMVVLLVGILYHKQASTNIRKYISKEFAILGGLNASKEYIIIIAYSMALATKVSLVFQLGILFSVLLGGMIFEEKHLGKRILGSVLIIGAVVLVS